MRCQCPKAQHVKCSSGTKKIRAALLLGLEQVKGCPAGNKQQSAELKLALHAEMLHSEVVLPVVRQGLVEAGVFFICDVLGHAASFTGIGHKTMPNFEETKPNILKPNKNTCFFKDNCNLQKTMPNCPQTCASTKACSCSAAPIRGTLP